MNKIFCDCCGKEIKSKICSFSYLCHLTNIAKGNYSNGYVDNEGEPVSGRQDGFDVCLHCYNRIMIEAVKKFIELKKIKPKRKENK